MERLIIVITRLSVLFLVLTSLVFAQQSGQFLIGESVSGYGRYFIGLGKTVTIGEVDVVAVAIGKDIFVLGPVMGDAYLFGDNIVINGNVSGLTKVVASHISIPGEVKTARIDAEDVVVSGSVDELNCECEKLIIKRGAHVRLLEGRAKEIKIEGRVDINNITRVDRTTHQPSPIETVVNWLKGMISMVILALLFRKHRNWSPGDLRDVMTYVYGTIAYVSPIFMFLLLLITIMLVDFTYLAWFGGGLFTALLGFYLILITVAGVPVYDIVGRTMTRPLGLDNFYLNIGVAYTLFYAMALLLPPVWVFVTISGSGLLLRGILSRNTNGEK